MTGRTFLNAVANGEVDLLQVFLDLLKETQVTYCVIGGLAVNAYAEPVVSLDLDLVVISDRMDDLCTAAQKRGMKVQEFPHSINLSLTGSDLRIQLQTDPRYQSFLPRAQNRKVLGYEMSVASVEDVLQGKAWAYGDDSRRKSKRLKDLADILRLVETHPHVAQLLSPELRAQTE